MDLQKVKKDIQSKTFDSMYVFTGEEGGVINIYINQIAKVKGVALQMCESVEQVYKAKNNKSFIKTDRVFVVMDDKEFISNEQAQKAIDKVLGDDVLCLIYTKLDKRNKFYKAYKDKLIEVEPLKHDVLVRYIMKECALSMQRASYLADITTYYTQAMNEVDKVNNLAKSLNTSADSAFDKLLDDRCITVPPEDSIFDFVKAVMLRDYNATYHYLDNCKRIGEAPLIMTSVLYNNAKQVLQVQSYNGNDLAKASGLTPWQIKCAREVMGKYSVSELVNIMDYCRKAEQDIKTGKLPPDVAIDYVLTHIL